MKRSGKRVNVPMFCAGILFCITAVSVFLSSGLYAKYTVRQVAADSSRVASFNVGLTPVAPFSHTRNNRFNDEAFSYNMTLNGNSEVDVNVDVNVVFDIGKVLEDKGYLKTVSSVTKAQLDRWFKNMTIGTTARTSTSYDPSTGKYTVIFSRIHEFKSNDSAPSVSKPFTFTVDKAFFEALEGDGYTGSSIQRDADGNVTNRSYYDGNGRTAAQPLYYTNDGYDFDNGVISIEDGVIPFTLKAKFTQID